MIEPAGIHLMPAIRVQQLTYGQIQVLYCLRAKHGYLKYQSNLKIDRSAVIAFG